MANSHPFHLPAGIVRNLVYPAYEALSGRRILSKWRELEESQWRSRAEIAERQWEKLHNLLVYANEHCTFYRKRFAQAGVKPEEIQAPEDLGRIPPLTRQDLLQHQKEILSDDAELSQLKPNATGGSGGEPAHFYNDRIELDYRSAVVLRNYHWAGLKPGKPQATIWGSAFDISLAESLGGRLTTRLLNRHFLKAFGLTLDNLRYYLAELQAVKPHVITGYTTILEALASAAIELQEDFQIEELRGVVASAEILLPEQRVVIEKAFKRPVFNRYGCREGGAIAHECEAGGMHINAENIYLEIVNERKPVLNGGFGEIALTMLNNRGFPMIRYLVGDAGRLNREICACGRGLPLLGELLGRTQDILVTVDGKLVPGVFFPHLMKEAAGVERFQVVQASLEELRIRLQVNERFGEMQQEFLMKHLRKQFGQGMQVKFEFVDEMSLPPSGKQRVTISECKIDFSRVQR